MMAQRRKNILFLMTDQQRLDYCGFSGSGKLATPNIDRLAESVGLVNCQTVNPICTPARAALLTGKYTHQIGMVAMSGDLSLQHPTYPRALQEAGYWTAGIGKFHFLQGWHWSAPRGKGHDLVAIRGEVKRYGFDHVWETAGKQLALKNTCDYCKHLDSQGLLEAFRDHVEGRGPNVDHPTGEREKKDFGDPWPFAEEDYVDVLTGEKIREAIDLRPRDRPFFVFGSFCGPHKPFDPPRRHLEMVEYEEIDDFIPGERAIAPAEKKRLYRKRRAYKGMILCIDEQIGLICDKLEDEGLLDETVILFASDHGEMLGDHFRVQKAMPWKESATVPAAIRHPDFPAKGADGPPVNASPVEITDLTATILDIAGVDPQQALSMDWPAGNNVVPCRSLMPIVDGRAASIREFTFSECDNQWQMIQTARWKHIRWLDYPGPDEPKESFFDLQADPDEIDDRIADPAYRQAIDWCRRRRDFVLDRTPPAQLRWAPLID